MNVLDYLKENIVLLDGGMGTCLQARGLSAGEYPERWNITHPDEVVAVHKAYFDAGSNIVSANTFGANALKFDDDELEEIISAAIKNVRVAAEKSSSSQEKFVALDIGPLGRLLKPFGDLDFENAVEIFAKTVRLGVKYGADLIYIETMNDSYETKAALLAAKENSFLPVFVSNAYSEDGKLMTGATPAAMVALLEGMGADAIGVNCSLGPKQLAPIIDEYLRVSSVPVLLKPNAGLPHCECGETVYDVSVEDFSIDVKLAVEKGVRIVGGCCGTTPEFIKALSAALCGVKPLEITKKENTVVSSYSGAVNFLNEPILIGERINPTGKKRFKQALVENDIGYILNEGLNQQAAGVHILDVNVGLPDINETEMLTTAICELQAVCPLPLQIDTSDSAAMESALRRYNGKALINSVNGKKESMESVFPLQKKYGGVVVALTLDENGIPSDAEGRIKIAKKILKTAESYGIDKKDIIFDTLALTISADGNAALETLKALDYIKHEMGCHTSLGVSNISFGLPHREAINSVFFANALERGLSAAIMNPYSADMMKTYYVYKALHALDNNCADYIAFAETLGDGATLATNLKNDDKTDGLSAAIISGLKGAAGEFAKSLLATKEPLSIVNDEVIPALDTVGKRFEQGTLYLPQLLMSAEAAQAAFSVIKEALPSGEATTGTVVLATVKGDIHDIGKNIVKLLLENYGFGVRDLGRDVSPETVVDEIIKTNAPIVALSALMTTTVPAMEETIRLVRARAPWCKVIVGGAVLNAEYAEKIGADKYAKDAMEAVRYAEEVNR